jgi:hypothetical protein
MLLLAGGYALMSQIADVDNSNGERPGEDTGAKGEVRRTTRTTENKNNKTQLFDSVSFE